MFNNLKKKVAEPDFQRGQELDSQHRYKDAISSYRRAIAIYPEYADALLNLIGDYYYINDYINCLKAIKIFTALYGFNDNIYGILGAVYDKLHNFKKAISNYKKAVSTNPQQETSYVNLAKDYQRIGNYKSEIISYKRAISLDPKSSYYSNLGKIYQNLRDMPVSQKFYKQAISIDNTNAQYYESLADVESNIQNKIIHLKQAIKIDPNRTSCLQKLSNAYCMLGNNFYNDKNYEDARKNYKKAALINSQNNIQNDMCYIMLAKVYHDLQDYDDEIKALKQAIKLNPKSSGNYNLIGIAYSDLGNDKQAITFYKDAIHLDNENDVLYGNLSTSYKKVQDYSDEINALKQAIKLNPHESDYYNQIGIAYSDLGNEKQAITFYKAAINLDNKSDVLYSNLSISYDNIQDYSDEINALKQAVKLNPKSDYYNSIGVAYNNLNDRSNAKKYFQRAINLNGNDAQYYENLANVETNIKTRIKDLYQAIKINPNNNDYCNKLSNNYYMLGNNFYNNKKYEGARHNYQAAIGFNHTNAKYYKKLADSESYLKDYGLQAAIKDYTKAIQLNNNYEQALSARVDAYYQLGEYSAEINDYKKLIQMSPHNNIYFNNLGFAYYRINDYKSAIFYYKKALSVNKDHITNDDKCSSLNNLSFTEQLVAKKSNNKQNSIKYYEDSILNCKKAINIDPKYLPPYNIMVSDYIGIKHYKKAIEVLKKLLKIDNNNPYHYYQLGVVYSLMGYNEQAVTYYRKYLSYNPKLSSQNKAKCYKQLADAKSKIKSSQLTPDYRKTIKLNPHNNEYHKAFNKHDKTAEKEKKHDYLKDLNSLIGLNSVKNQLQTEINHVKADKRLGESTSGHGNINSIFEGNPGTGKTTVAKLLGKILYQKNITQNDNFEYVNATRLQSTIVGGSAKRMRAYIHDAMGGVLFIDEAYALSNKHMSPVVETLLSAAEDYKNDLVIILAGYTKQIENLRNSVNPGFKSRFKRIKFPDYNYAECQQIFELFMNKHNLKFNTKETHTLLNKDLKQFISIKKSEDQSNFANARTVRNIYDDLQDTFDNRIATMSESRFKQLKTHGLERDITTSDVKKTFNKYNITNEDRPKSSHALEKLNNLVGLSTVKRQVRTYIRKRKMDIVLHNYTNDGIDLVFEGSPGTGKTTVARLLAQILYDIGMIKTRKFKEVQGSDLTGQYAGQTKNKARKIIHSALGGVLFIDEAYTLAHNPNDTSGNNDYKDEAIAELVAEVENHRSDLAVIMAGYTVPMNFLFKYSNPGLTRRFKTRIMFTAYDNDECYQILQLMLRKKHIKMNNSTKMILKNQFYQALTIDRNRESTRFGNGGYVRNIVDDLSDTIDNRVAVLPMPTLLNMRKNNPDKLRTLTKDDVNNTFANLPHNN